MSQLRIYIYTAEDQLQSSSTFEQIFNNTNIGQLHFYGSIIRPSSSSLRGNFHGSVRSLTVHRRVDTIDGNAFPFYPNVHSYTVYSIGAHSMNLSSFVSSHQNLRELKIIKPHFEVSIDQLIPTLDSLTIDVENLNEKTLLAARHVYNLKLGSRLRRIEPRMFALLSKRLRRLDLSNVDLSKVQSDSRCRLVKYLSENFSHHSNIVFPRTKSSIECNCAQLFIDQIRLKQKPTIGDNASTCLSTCYFTDCQTIRQHFRENYRLFIDENRSNSIDNETINGKNGLSEYFPTVEMLSDPLDIRTITFLLDEEQARAPK